MLDDTTITPPEAPPLPSWESASEPADAPAPAGDSPQPDAPAPAETTALETATDQLPVDQAVRESEAPSEVDEDIEEGDTPEIQALPSGSSSRRWARQQYKDAKPIRDFLNVDQSIKNFGDELHSRSPSRYAEHVFDVFDHHADDFCKKAFGMKFADAKARLTPNGQPAPSESTSDLTVEQVNEMSNEQVIQKLADAKAQSKAEAESALQTKVDELQKQLDAVTGKLNDGEKRAFETRAQEEGQKLHDKVWGTVVDGGIRDSGLEVKADDPPEVARLKKAAAKILKDNTDLEFAGDGDESRLTAVQKENRKLIRQVQEFINRDESRNAWREEDNLVIRGRQAFERVKQTEEVQAILEQIKALGQSKTTSRTGGPVVPAPGSSAGMAIKPPTTWDEAESQARAASR